MHCGAKKAFSLAEVLMAMGLALLLSLVAFRIFVPSLTYSAEGTARLDLQQSARLAMQTIALDLSHTRPLAISTAPDALALVPQVSMDGSGLPIWSDKVVVFHLEGKTLSRYELDGKTPVPGHYTPAELAGLSLPAPTKKLADSVVAFEVTDPIPATDVDPPLPLQVRLVLEKTVARRGPVRITFERSFSPRTAN